MKMTKIKVICHPQMKRPFFSQKSSLIKIILSCIFCGNENDTDMICQLSKRLGTFWTRTSLKVGPIQEYCAQRKTKTITVRCLDKDIAEIYLGLS